jgi:hypothetical protein
MGGLLGESVSPGSDVRDADSARIPSKAQDVIKVLVSQESDELSHKRVTIGMVLKAKPPNPKARR